MNALYSEIVEHGESDGDKYEDSNAEEDGLHIAQLLHNLRSADVGGIEGCVIGRQTNIISALFWCTSKWASQKQ